MHRIHSYNQVVLKVTDDVGNVNVLPWNHILSVDIASLSGGLSTVVQADDCFHVSRDDALKIADLLVTVLKGFPVDAPEATDYDSEG